MKKQTSRRKVIRWDRPRSVDPVSAYAERVPTVRRQPRTTEVGARMGPYEARYDISAGYCQDRSIVVP